jgi:DNA ligase 1
MKAFADLYAALDATTSTRAKVAALAQYFSEAPPADAAWALYFLAGGKPRQTVPTALIKSQAQAMAGISPWLFEESYAVVGDLAETVAYLLPPASQVVELPLHQWMHERLLPLKGQPPEAVLAQLGHYWMSLDTASRFLLTKLIGGGFRVGVSRSLVLRALAEISGRDAKLLAQRLMGYTDKTAQPTALRYLALLADAASSEAAGLPYPFFLAHSLQTSPQTLGPRTDWLVEWKWDGIRAQWVHRAGQWWWWSRGEELLNERFPELDLLARHLPDGTVLDGEILVWRDGHVAPFAELQKRIGRKLLSKKLLADLPVLFMAYDLLEWQGQDLRQQPQRQRRLVLDQLVAQALLDAPALPLRASPVVTAPDWDSLALLRQTARARSVEGFMLKHQDGQYGMGRTKDVGQWWKWKLEPLTVDAVLIYAQSGHGRRANLYSDYTFAVWDDTDPGGTRQLVPFAKAYSGLTDDEMRQVDQRIRETTTERFGPVRSVRASLVVELGFEGIAASSRHKSGVAVRFPRMLRLRWDKPVNEADSLSTLKALLPSPGNRA